MKNNKGFSLVELIVVIAIMAILAAVAIPTFATFIDKANIASDVSFVNDFKYAAELAHTATGNEVTGVKVTVDDGKVTKAEYMVVGEGTVTITVGNDGKGTASAVDTNNVADNDLANDAQTAADTIDWGYTFKKYKGAATATAYELDPDKDNKALK